MCRNQSEVTTILNSCGNLDEGSEDELDQQAFEEGIPNLARLRLAVNYNQKQVGPQALTPQNKKNLHFYLCMHLANHWLLFVLQFVAHPICQQVLSSIWCGSLSGWRGSRTAWKILVSLGIFLTMPILCLIYWIAPKSKVCQIYENIKKLFLLLVQITLLQWITVILMIPFRYYAVYT